MGINIKKLRKQIRKNNIKLILFAEVHGLIDETYIQEKILREIKSDVFLYELLEEDNLIFKEDYKRFLNNSGDSNFSLISKYSDLKKTAILSNKLNMKLIGCDIKDMGRTFKIDFQNENIDPTKEEDIIIKREERQNEVILRELKKRGEKKIFASIGAHHLRKGSLTLKGLKDYIIIYPIDPDTNKFPKEFSRGVDYNYKIIIEDAIDFS
tara:strand:- start:2246 stop:2875 length:630 start_codon:yes stop_codon:yes gene_type:complete